MGVRKRRTSNVPLLLRAGLRNVHGPFSRFNSCAICSCPRGQMLSTTNEEVKLTIFTRQFALQCYNLPLHGRED